MSKLRLKTVFVAIAVVAMASLGVVISVGGKRDGAENETPKQIRQPIGHRGPNQHARFDRRQQRKTKQKIPAKSAEPLKITFESIVDGLVSEKDLDEEVRKTIVALQAALDENEKEKVFALVRQLQQMAYGRAGQKSKGTDGTHANKKVPKSVRLMAINALGWFGASGLPEIAGFLGDESAEVVQAAIDKYAEALSDFYLGDRDRSLILRQAAQVINDTDSMNFLMFELNNMRHSVAVETMKAMMTDGTQATKSVLPESIQFYTGEENIDTPAKLDEWLAQNPDDQYDEDFYGPLERAK